MKQLPDSGERTAFTTGAVRDASLGKGIPSMIPPTAIRRMGKRFEDGASKYGAGNWMKGIPLSRYQDAIMRHTLAAAEGQTDEDHIGAILWNAAAWAWTEEAISSGALPKELDDLLFKRSDALRSFPTMFKMPGMFGDREGVIHFVNEEGVTIESWPSHKLFMQFLCMSDNLAHVCHLMTEATKSGILSNLDTREILSAKVANKTATHEHFQRSNA